MGKIRETVVKRETASTSEFSLSWLGESARAPKKEIEKITIFRHTTASKMQNLKLTPARSLAPQICLSMNYVVNTQYIGWDHPMQAVLSGALDLRVTKLYF